jgi:hypothetical protein
MELQCFKEFPLSQEMPKPATLGSEELLGYGLRPAHSFMLGTDLSNAGLPWQLSFRREHARAAESRDPR